MVPKFTLPPVDRPSIQFTTRNISTPAQLNIRCMRAVRFAFLLLVMPAMMATTQEPMFEPIVRYMP